MLKLIRVDSKDSSFEIVVPPGPGTHFGRGVFLDCNDKRVSRRHGKLDIADNSISLTALHTNPCFVAKKSTTTTQVLKSGSSVTLTDGDRFGLLPDTYWYRVETETDNTETSHERGEELLDFPFDEEMTCEDPITRSDSPSLLGPQTSEENTHLPVAESERAAPHAGDSEQLSLHARTAQRPPSTTADVTRQAQTSPSSAACSTKRAHTPESSDTVPCKQSSTQGDDIKPTTSQLRVAMEATTAQSSATCDADVECKNQVKTERAETPPPSPVVLGPARERCYYGAQCYRRSAQHKLDYSHPQDPDWGPGKLGVCPWGATCGRREPRHWLTHTHPPGTAQPTHNTHRGPPTTVVRHGATFYISAHSVHFHDDHFSVEDSDGDSIDYDYEF